MSKVYVICTGGTVGMSTAKQGLVLIGGTIEDKIKKVLDPLKHPEMPNVTVKELFLIDSSQMNLKLWNSIANEIYEQYDNYDGFVVLHGTDTMAYTGSALSFMLQNLSKPIVLTGAQTPLEEIVNDARENIINSIFIAGGFPTLNHVCIYFNQKLLQANRATKVSTLNYTAYQSPNYPELGAIGSRIEMHPNILSTQIATKKKPVLIEFKPVDIRTIRITPFLTEEALKSVLLGAKAVILETYGDGNMPTEDAFLNLLSEANEKGVVLINRSQCPNSRTDLSKYSEGAKLGSRCDVVSAGDQTIEATLAKLNYFFSMECSPTDIKVLMKQNFCGELTPYLDMYKANMVYRYEHLIKGSKEVKNVPTLVKSNPSIQAKL